MGIRANAAAAAILCCAAIGTAALSQPASADESQGNPPGRHVLLISVDGLHASDLSRWVSEHPSSTLARLSSRGTTYSNAMSPVPTDSFPGLLALVTGGTPRSTGVYYDNSYDRSLFAPSATSCSGQPGANVLFDGTIDRNPDAQDAGGNLGDPNSQIDPAQLPQAAVRDEHGKVIGCRRVYPHDFIRVNTIFNVAHDRGLVTAWADKHPSYDIVNGPGGHGVTDLYTPEIDAPPSSSKAPGDTQAFDLNKADVVLNQINGWNSTHTTRSGVPAIFGMNFQAVSVAEKDTYSVFTSSVSPCGGAWGGLETHIGGYCPDGSFTPQMDDTGTHADGSTGALNFVDAQLGRMVDALRARGLLDSTLIVITAKHGQSPIEPAIHQRVDDTPLANELVDPSQDQLTDDDGAFLWFRSDHQGSVPSAVSDLEAQRAGANPAKIQDIVSGDAIKHLFGDPARDSRVPDIMIQPQTGVVYSGNPNKVAEHGGAAPGDRRVALLVASPAGDGGSTVDQQVGTTSVAPTILEFLGLDARKLAAVRNERTPVLPSEGQTSNSGH